MRSTSTHGEAVAREQAVERGQREVAEVLVVDRVELAAARSGRGRTGTSMTATPSGLSTMPMPATKPLRSATCASTLLAWMTSARRPSAASRRPRPRPKNSRAGRDAARLGHRGDVAAPARCRAPGRPAARSAAAGSRRCWRSRSPATAGAEPALAGQAVGQSRGASAPSCRRYDEK